MSIDTGPKTGIDIINERLAVLHQDLESLNTEACEQALGTKARDEQRTGVRAAIEALEGVRRTMRAGMGDGPTPTEAELLVSVNGCLLGKVQAYHVEGTSPDSVEVVLWLSSDSRSVFYFAEQAMIATEENGGWFGKPPEGYEPPAAASAPTLTMKEAARVLDQAVAKADEMTVNTPPPDGYTLRLHVAPAVFDALRIVDVDYRNGESLHYGGDWANYEIVADSALGVDPREVRVEMTQHGTPRPFEAREDGDLQR